MRHDEINVLGAESRRRQGALARGNHDANRLAEDLAALHVDEAAEIAAERLLQLPVAVQRPTQQGVVLRRRGGHHHGPGAVAEEDGRRAVLPVHEPGEGLRADEQDVFGARQDQTVSHVESVDETRAGGVQVEGPAAGSEGRLHGTGGGRDHPIRRRRGEDDGVQAFSGYAGHLQGSPAGVYREGAG